MSANLNTSAPAVRTFTRPNDDSWKAQGFLNFSLPGAGGKMKKLGSIPLKAAKPQDKALLEWLNEDPSRVALIMAKLVLTYQSADGDGEKFDLGVAPVAPVAP